MSEESLMGKTVQELVDGPDDELLQVLFLLSKESRKRSEAKMRDPAYRASLEAGVAKIFGSKPRS